MPDYPFVEIYISCVAKDRNHELLTILSGLESKGVALWHPGKITPGADRSEDRKKHLDQAHIAILLLGQEWLDDQDIQNHEVPEIRRCRESDGIDVIPVVLRPCTIEAQDSEWLRSIQPFPNVGETVQTDYENDGRRTQLFIEIRRVLNKCVDVWLTKLPPRTEATLAALIREAEEFARGGQNRLAHNAYEAALKKCENEPTPKTASLLIRAADCDRKIGEQFAAYHKYTLAFGIAERLGAKPVRSHALNGHGNILREQGHLARAAQCYRDSLSLLPQGSEFIPRVRINLGATLRRIGEFQEAKSEMLLALEEYDRLASLPSTPAAASALIRSRGIACGMLSLCYLYQELDLVKAMSWAREGLDIAIEHDNSRGIGFAKHRVAAVFIAQRLWSEATRLLDESLRTAREVGDTREVFAVLIDQGRCLAASGYPEDAERHLFTGMMHGVRTF